MHDDYSTQLSDIKPKFDSPLRIALPINSPNLTRSNLSSHDDCIRNHVFSSNAVIVSKRTDYDQKSSSDEANNLFSLISSSNSDSLADTLSLINDYKAVAFSSKRIGKKEEEKNAYLSLGVIYDNTNELLTAIVQYDKYLTISSSMDDLIGISTACNYIGVNYMFLVSPISDCGCVEGANTNIDSTVIASNSPQQDHDLIDVKYLQKAIQYHKRHLEIGPDDGGRFVASTNLG